MDSNRGGRGTCTPLLCLAWVVRDTPLVKYVVPYPHPTQITWGGLGPILGPTLGSNLAQIYKFVNE